MSARPGHLFEERMGLYWWINTLALAVAIACWPVPTKRVRLFTKISPIRYQPPPRGKGTVESCNFCTQRVDRGGTPACVEACDANGHKALVFGDMNDPDSELSRQLREKSSVQIRADLNLNTGVRYHGV